MLNRVSRKIRIALEGFDESGMTYWMVRATLRDGRVFSNVFITDSWGLGFPDLCPFQAADIVEVEWEGHRANKHSGVPVLVRDDG